MVENNPSNSMAIADRISELPDHLIIHILSFLPTFNVVQTSLLSKRWKHIWISVPVICFLDYLGFKLISYSKREQSINEQQMFLKFVDNYMSRRQCEHCRKLSADTSITRFKLDMEYLGFSTTITERIDNWLSFALQSNVKELDLKFYFEKHYHYCLPQSVLNSTSLTVLNLHFCKLESLGPISLPSLRILSLNCVQIDNQMLRNLISGCPIIEDLDLNEYPSSSLHETDLAVSGTLRKLSLTRVWELNAEWLESQISRLPLLERLVLHSSVGLQRLSINSHSLKYFSICNDNRKLPKICVTFRNTPNLVHFHFDICSVKPMFSFDAPTNLYVKVNNFIPYSYLITFLSTLNFLKKMTLDINSEKNLIVPEGVRKISNSPLITNLKHLKVRVFDNQYDSNKTELRDTLLWLAPSLETLEIEGKKRRKIDSSWFTRSVTADLVVMEKKQTKTVRE